MFANADTFGIIAVLIGWHLAESFIHNLRPFDAKVARLVLISVLLAAIGYILFGTALQPAPSLARFVSILLAWGVAVYLLIVELLLIGLAGWLNEKLVPQGRWIREIEYPYLMLGLFGLFFTVNRLPNLEGRIEHVDLLGPIVIVAAVAIKLVKTRAEVYDWGKLKFEGRLPPPKLPPSIMMEYLASQKQRQAQPKGDAPSSVDGAKGPQSS